MLIPFLYQLAFLPARLDDAWDFTIQRELPEAQTADAEFAQEPARASAAPAAIAVAAGELRLSLLLVSKFVRVRKLLIFCDFGGCCH
jgi:hypothetical protein